MEFYDKWMLASCVYKNTTTGSVKPVPLYLLDWVSKALNRLLKELIKLSFETFVDWFWRLMEVKATYINV